MKTLLVATFVDFWMGGSGHRSRISSLLEFLQTRVRITVLFAGTLSDKDVATLRTLFPNIRVESAATSQPLTYGDYADEFGRFIKDKTFDFVLVEYIELSSVLQHLPEDTITFLDTHDLVAGRIDSFKKLGLPYEGIDLTVDDELSIFRCFDYVILIQHDDFDTIAQWMDLDRLILAPHAVPAKKTPIRSQARHLGFVASAYRPNVEALTWFLQEVWVPIAQHSDLTLDIYGNIHHAFPTPTAPNVRFHGFVPDLGQVYQDCDIIINPIRCGAGLKIKNVEALAHGLPLVTTTHGAAGLNGSDPPCFLKADDPIEFSSAIKILIEDHPLRTQLGENAYNYSRIHFSPESCYGAIANLIT